jgi:GTP cyclohydrolase I
MYLDELCSGYRVDVANLFRVFDDHGYGGMIVVKDIPLTSLCEHHLVPFVGYAHVGYFPSGKVVGLSKIARVVDAYARRLQIQERLTMQVADAIETHLQPRGVMVLIEAEHMCMTIRGVQKAGTRTVTAEARGVFTANRENERDQLLRLVRGAAA